MKKVIKLLLVITIQTILATSLFLSMDELGNFSKDLINALLVLITYVTYFRLENVDLKFWNYALKKKKINPLGIKKLFLLIMLLGLIEITLGLNKNQLPIEILKLYSINSLIIFPIIEEILFRAYLFNYLNYKKKSALIVVSSLLFAFYHFEFEPKRFLLLFIAGGFLGMIYLLTENIAVTIIAHSIYNLISYFSFMNYSYLVHYIGHILIFFVYFIILLVVIYIANLNNDGYCL